MTLRERKIQKARVLFKFKCDRYTRWFGYVSSPNRTAARLAAAAKYGIDPTDI